MKKINRGGFAIRGVGRRSQFCWLGNWGPWKSHIKLENIEKNSWFPAFVWHSDIFFLLNCPPPHQKNKIYFNNILLLLADYINACHIQIVKVWRRKTWFFFIYCKKIFFRVCWRLHGRQEPLLPVVRVHGCSFRTRKEKRDVRAWVFTMAMKLEKHLHSTTARPRGPYRTVSTLCSPTPSSSSSSWESFYYQIS